MGPVAGTLAMVPVLVLITAFILTGSPTLRGVQAGRKQLYSIPQVNWASEPLLQDPEPPWQGLLPSSSSQADPETNTGA